MLSKSASTRIFFDPISIRKPSLATYVTPRSAPAVVGAEQHDTIAANIINMVAGDLSIKYGLKGPNYSIVSACSTGAHNIADAMRMIQYGTVDVMIAGGAEMGTSPTGLGGFAAARALSTRNDDPQAASRPWDQERDGFVLSDGAGVLMLEELEHAKARGAKIYAEVAGYGLTGDAHHITAPAEGAEGGYRAMKMATDHASRNLGMSLEEIFLHYYE